MAAGWVDKTLADLTYLTKKDIYIKFAESGGLFMPCSLITIPIYKANGYVTKFGM